MKPANLLLFLLVAATGSAVEPLKVHFVSGSKEYGSEPSLKTYEEHLEGQYKIEVTASWVRDGAKDLPAVESVPEADVLLVFARRMKLPEDQMAVLRAHWEAGKPVVGLRTASHAFGREDNEVFDRRIMGGNYIGHFGNEPVRVAVTEAGKDHPVLQGVGEIVSRRLYKAGDLAESAVRLQDGSIEGKGDSTNAVTWVNDHNGEAAGGRAFYTSLGVQSDFDDPDFLRLVDNAIFWTSEKRPADYRK